MHLESSLNLPELSGLLQSVFRIIELDYLRKIVEVPVVLAVVPVVLAVAPVATTRMVTTHREIKVKLLLQLQKMTVLLVWIKPCQ